MTGAQRVRLCQLLLAKAARTNFPAEAEACREKARTLAAKYNISEADLAPRLAPLSPLVAGMHTVVFTGGPIVVVITGSTTMATGTSSSTWWTSMG
jgi:hypothetical protein